MSLVLSDNAVTTARELFSWMDANVDSATRVANKIVSDLEKCFSSKA